jgi:heat shock protein HslJ
MKTAFGAGAIRVGWIVMLALPGACGGPETVSPGLAGSSWRVQDYADPANPGRMVSALSDAAPNLEFGHEGTVRGAGGCNSFQGSYLVRGDSLSFGPLASTMMYCGDPEGVMEQEAAFLSTLESAETFKLDDSELTIQGPGGSAVVSLRLLPDGGAGARNDPPPRD